MEDAMMAQIKNFLRSLSEIPEGKFPPSHYTPSSRRTINLGNYLYLAAFAWILILTLVWLLLRLYILLIVELLDILVSIASFILR